MRQAETKIRFGTDGIRQIVGEWPLNAPGAQQIGLGLGKYLKKVNDNPCVIIGRDTRISGDFLFTSLCSGLLAYGVDVIDVGIITTAGISYLTRTHRMEIGIVISASHNPWTENGIKLIGSDGLKLSNEIEEVIENNVNSDAFDSVINTYGHISRKDEWVEEYIQYLIAPFKDLPFKRLRLAFDCSNGAASRIAPRCFELLGSEVVVLHNLPTGININLNCGSEMVRESKGDLIPVVLEERAHFGVAFDGDADRAVFVDEYGNLVDGDHILYIFARYLDSNGDLLGRTVVTTEMANSALDTALSKVGITTKRTKVGDKYVVRELSSKNYRLGGEQSGHIIVFDEEHTTGDGVYTALYLAQILLRKGKPTLSKLTSGLEKLPQVIVSAYVSKKPDVNKLDDFIMERERISNDLGEDTVINTRYSGTEPLFRVMIQGTNVHSLEMITREAIKLSRVLQSRTGDKDGSLEVKDCTSGALIDIS